jgi:hypothetical protein
MQRTTGKAAEQRAGARVDPGSILTEGGKKYQVIFHFTNKFTCSGNYFVASQTVHVGVLFHVLRQPEPLFQN